MSRIAQLLISATLRKRYANRTKHAWSTSMSGRDLHGFIHRRRKMKPAAVAGSIWRDPATYPGSLYGAAHARTNGVFTFVREDPKPPAQSSISRTTRASTVSQAPDGTGIGDAATRFLWAAGYFVDEDYYLATLKVRNAGLHRGASFVLADGTSAEPLERRLKDGERRAEWDWFDNPFVHGRELNGRGDVAVEQLGLSERTTRHPEAWRSRFGLRRGATFSNTGNSLTRSSVPKTMPSRHLSKTAQLRRLRATQSSVLPVCRQYPQLSRPGWSGDKHIPRADAEWPGAGCRGCPESKSAMPSGRVATPREVSVHAFDGKRIAELGALLSDRRARGRGPAHSHARARGVWDRDLRFDRRDIEIARKRQPRRSALA